MSRERDKILVALEISKHQKWDFTDYDGDQIRCECSWVSWTFDLDAYNAPKVVFADHIVDVIDKMEWK